MQLGAIFPQTEIGADPAAVRDFAQAAESLGYQHLLVFDHVLGADPSKRDSWDRPYSHTDMFHEPFVLFGYLAGVTETIQMTTGVLIMIFLSVYLIFEIGVRLEAWSPRLEASNTHPCSNFCIRHPNSLRLSKGN